MAVRCVHTSGVRTTDKGCRASSNPPTPQSQGPQERERGKACPGARAEVQRPQHVYWETTGATHSSF